MRTLLRRFGGAWLLLACVSAAAAPGGVAVSPLRLDLNATQTSAALTVANRDTRPRRFQIVLLGWTQDDRGDQFGDAEALLANPPLFELAPDAQQIVRVGNIKLPPAAVEQAFRIYVAEIPEQGALKDGQLNFLLRLSVPLYVAPSATAHRAWRWSAYRDGNAYVLRADNDGNVHQRRAQLHVVDADRGTALGDDAGFRDVLPGAHALWRFPAQPPYAQRLRLTATTDIGTDESTVPLGTP
ncbi:fimbrial biogenesis chaperone [Solimonas marina]|uniref:Molecular chaperone n=1 Tax=Solimonas marina TaxID=2714601 RepID=A0A969W8C2_9GAMM|nr:fimbria/pilus periplasmic chaperone [Solimonas marina]NKF21764.1 molecular chaperone [Solimonas marina]